MMNTAAYSYVSQAYPDEVEKKISLMEGIVGVGCTFSPVLGSFVYSNVGFSTTFYIFGGCMLPISLLNFFALKTNMNEKTDDVLPSEVARIEEENTKLLTSSVNDRPEDEQIEESPEGSLNNDGYQLSYS